MLDFLRKVSEKRFRIHLMVKYFSQTEYRSNKKMPLNFNHFFEVIVFKFANLLSN